MDSCEGRILYESPVHCPVEGGWRVTPGKCTSFTTQIRNVVLVPAFIPSKQLNTKAINELYTKTLKVTHVGKGHE